MVNYDFTFSMSNPINEKKIIFLLGGPGSGKGTVSERIRSKYNVGYMCAGDLLRKEAKQDTEFGRDLAEQLRLGKIVPQEVTFRLLKQEIESQDKDFYIIDGFPRAVNQAIDFESTIYPSLAVIFIQAPDEVLVHRLTSRGKTSGRSDDNEESIRLRIKVFHSQSYPVVEHFEKFGKVHRIDATGNPDEVFTSVSQALDKVISTTN